MASIVVGHSCQLSETIVKYINMTAEFVATVMYREIAKKTCISPFQIMLVISNRFSYEISYDMAWRAKQKVL